VFAPGLVKVEVDIKPGGCPNPLNLKDKGDLPVAILGTDRFDVFTIDAASIRIAGVAPIRSNYEDVATRVYYRSNECDCTEEGSDGFLDLVVKFRVQDIVQALGNVQVGQTIPLTLTGALTSDYGLTPIEGKDCVVIRGE